MLHLKDSPRGIDVPIQKFQEYLYETLPQALKIDNPEKMYDCFGRVYRNQKGGGFVPEVFTEKKDYREAFIDDKKHLISFFGVEDTQRSGLNMTANVFLIFLCDLQKLYPDVKHRADSEIQCCAMMWCGKRLGEFVSINTGIDSVFKGFAIKQITYSDLQPYHCFRLNYRVYYDDDEC